MRAEFFQAPTNQGTPAVFYGPQRRPAGYQDMTRQMTGEPALRKIYGRNGVRMAVCPDCGLEVGPAEEHFDVELGKNPIEGFLLLGMVVTYRYHAKCTEIPWEEAIRRVVRAVAASLR